MMASLPSGAEELLGKPVSDLEAELRRLTSKSRMPPSAVRQLFESYELQSRLADAAQRESSQRMFLIHAIVACRKPEFQLRAGEDFSVSDLTKIALTIPMKEGIGNPTAQQRQDTLDDLLKVYEQETFKPEDRDFYRRLALAGFISENCPGTLERPMLYAFDLGDVYLDYPYEEMKFRYEKKTGKVFVRFYGKPECEVEHSYSFYREAMSAGTQITEEEYFRD